MLQLNTVVDFECHFIFKSLNWIWETNFRLSFRKLYSIFFKDFCSIKY